MCHTNTWPTVFSPLTQSQKAGVYIGLPKKAALLSNPSFLCRVQSWLISSQKDTHKDSFPMFMTRHSSLDMSALMRPQENSNCLSSYQQWCQGYYLKRLKPQFVMHCLCHFRTLPSPEQKSHSDRFKNKSQILQLILYLASNNHPDVLYQANAAMYLCKLCNAYSPYECHLRTITRTTQIHALTFGAINHKLILLLTICRCVWHYVSLRSFSAGRKRSAPFILCRCQPPLLLSRTAPALPLAYLALS